MSGLRVIWRPFGRLVVICATQIAPHLLQRLDVVKLELLVTHCLKPLHNRLNSWCVKSLKMTPPNSRCVSESSETLASVIIFPTQTNTVWSVWHQEKIIESWHTSTLFDPPNMRTFTLQSYKSWLQDGKSCAPRLSWTSIELSGSKPWGKWMNMTHLLVKEALVLDISHDFQPNHDWRTSVYSFCTFGCIFFDTLFRRCLTGFGSFVCPNGN